MKAVVQSLHLFGIVGAVLFCNILIAQLILIILLWKKVRTGDIERLSKKGLAKEAGKCAFYVMSVGMGNSGYALLSHDITSKICALYPSSIRVVYKTSDLPDWILKRGKTHKRGFGYWSWKPFCVNHLLTTTARDGDIVAYVDGRCGLSGKRITYIDAIMNDARIDVCGWQMPHHAEQVWSRADLMASFGVALKSRHATSGQFAAGLFVIRVNGKTRELIRRWLAFIETQFDMVTDGQSQVANAANFHENRHDQSVLSMLLKTTPGLNIHVVNSIDPVVPGSKPHPTDD